MNVNDLAQLMNKPVQEIEQLLEQENTIAINLAEKNKKQTTDNFDLEII